MDKIFKMIHDNIIDHNNLQFICFDSGINNIKSLSVCLSGRSTTVLHIVAHVLSLQFWSQ